MSLFVAILTFSKNHEILESIYINKLSHYTHKPLQGRTKLISQLPEVPSLYKEVETYCHLIATIFLEPKTSVAFHMVIAVFLPTEVRNLVIAEVGCSQRLLQSS